MQAGNTEGCSWLHPAWWCGEPCYFSSEYMDMKIPGNCGAFPCSIRSFQIFVCPREVQNLSEEALNPLNGTQATLMNVSSTTRHFGESFFTLTSRRPIRYGLSRSC